MDSSKKYALGTFGLMALGLAASAQATVIASENFGGYSTGTNTLSGDGASGNGWTSAWELPHNLSGTSYNVVSPGLDPSNSPNNSAQIAASGANAAYIFRGVSLPTTGTYYVSFDWNLEGSTSTVNGLILNTSTTQSAYEVIIGYTSVGNSGGDINLYAPSGAASSSTVSSNSSYVVNTGPGNSTTYHLVAEIDTSTASNGNGYVSSIELYVNPGATQPATPDARITGYGTNLNALNTLQLYGSAGSNEQFDDIVFGTTFADALPEPASLGMLALSASALLFRRRRPQS